MYFGERVKLKKKDKKDMAEVKSALGRIAKRHHWSLKSKEKRDFRLWKDEDWTDRTHLNLTTWIEIKVPAYEKKKKNVAKIQKAMKKREITIEDLEEWNSARNSK